MFFGSFKLLEASFKFAEASAAFADRVSKLVNNCPWVKRLIAGDKLVTV